MTNSKKILITTESLEIFTVRINGKSNVLGFCLLCAIEAEMLTLDAAVALSGIGTRELVKRLDTGEMHFWETRNGHLYICRESLRQECTRARFDSGAAI